VNEKLKQQLSSLLKIVESRNQAEKLILLAVAIAAVSMVFLTYFYDPLAADIAGSRNKINTVNTQITSQQAGYAAKLAESLEDPDKFANDRLQVIMLQQQTLINEIANLAGDLITPNQMTAILGSVLGRQSGLELIRFENEEAKPLRSGLQNSGGTLNGTGSAGVSEQIAGQVYEHGLTIEFEGDFFNTLRYLKFLEEISGSFFWDSITFDQSEWPNALITLKIHTLSTEQGFIGV
jgi:MSHA biogenesis protein MshJ